MEHVTPDGILKELARLWVTLGSHGEGDASAGVLRACSMTLIVVTRAGEAASEVSETLAALMPEHPARAIVVRLGASELSAQVVAQCWLPFGGRRQICSEQIEISAPESSLSELAAVIAPVCAPDLPVMLWSRYSPLPGLADFAHLAGVNKVIVDSAPLDARIALPRLAEAVGEGGMLADLSWTRLTRWRETLSRLFENRQYQARIRELARVRVCFGGSDPPAAAWYLAAWLAGGLRAAGCDPAAWVEHDPNAPAGEIASLQLLAADDKGLRVILVVRDEVLSLRVNGTAQTTVLPRSTLHNVLGEELAIVRRDPVFEETLSSAAQLAISSEVK